MKGKEVNFISVEVDYDTPEDHEPPLIVSFEEKENNRILDLKMHANAVRELIVKGLEQLGLHGDETANNVLIFMRESVLGDDD